VESDYLFGDSSQRFGCGKSSVIKETLEMLPKAASKENITKSEFVECAIAISCNRVK
jgi:hypothetical protein